MDGWGIKGVRKAESRHLSNWFRIRWVKGVSFEFFRKKMVFLFWGEGLGGGGVCGGEGVWRREKGGSFPVVESSGI